MPKAEIENAKAIMKQYFDEKQKEIVMEKNKLRIYTLDEAKDKQNSRLHNYGF